MAKLKRAKSALTDLCIDLHCVAYDSLEIFNPIGPDNENLDYKTLDVIRQRLAVSLSNIILKTIAIKQMLDN